MQKQMATRAGIPISSSLTCRPGVRSGVSALITASARSGKAVSFESWRVLGAVSLT
jgi:hypothetical protein